MSAVVASVARSPEYTFQKPSVDRIRLIEGLGVEGDVHAGRTVRHRSRVKQDPTRPNLRQVHLIASELLDTLRGEGFDVSPGRLGENVLTVGVDLLSLPTGTRLLLGEDAEIEITGLRNPCVQLNDVGPGLMQRLVSRAEDGSLIRRAGVMAIVRRSGNVAPSDPIGVRLPDEPHRSLERV